MSAVKLESSRRAMTHHAMLIGVGMNINISSHQENQPNDRSLKGAVPDVNAVAEYLRSQDHIKITKLTASKRSTGDHAGTPIEASEDLPTIENVYSVLRGLIQGWKYGQYKHIYIHFSGHGTRISGTGEFALVLYHDSPRGSKYLRGSELARVLDKMAGYGMHVTLVLDCCFSAGVTRTDQSVKLGTRFIEYDPIIDAESAASECFDLGIEDIVRDSALKLDRLLDPKGYTIITACGPHEVAREIEFASGAWRGALSYFLDYCLRSLRKASAQITYLSLYQHLQSRFHANYPQQTPMRYGNSQISFFGLMCESQLSFIPIFCDRHNKRVVLDAGYAHCQTH